MTLQHPDSRLVGWRGPVFPAVMPRLIETLQAMSVGQRSAANLRAELVSVAGLEGLVELTATDGYAWPVVGVVAVQPSGVVAVALPRADLDRSPAVYMKGQHVNEETANAILARVIRALRPNPGRRPVL